MISPFLPLQYIATGFLTMSTSSTTKPVFKYLQLPLMARGGVVNNFLGVHGVAFDSTLIPMSEWGATEKERTTREENPCGTLPIVFWEGKTLVQHISTMRYIANVSGLAPRDPWASYVQDLVADEYQGWRNSWVGAVFGDDQAKAAYKESVAGKLSLFEALYTKYKVGTGPYLSTSPSGKGLWGDAAVFGLLWDNIKTGMISEEQISGYPHLDALYKASMAEPAIQQWIANNK